MLAIAQDGNLVDTGDELSNVNLADAEKAKHNEAIRKQVEYDPTKEGQDILECLLCSPGYRVNQESECLGHFKSSTCLHLLRVSDLAVHTVNSEGIQRTAWMRGAKHMR